ALGPYSGPRRRGSQVSAVERDVDRCGFVWEGAAGFCRGFRFDVSRSALIRHLAHAHGGADREGTAGRGRGRGAVIFIGERKGKRKGGFLGEDAYGART